MRAQEFIQEVKARYEMTDLDPWTFDQTPAGWRGLPSSARQADALNQYIDRYVKDGQFVGAPEGVKTVRPYILYWHLGQVLTQMGRNGMAARVMRQALDDSDPNWNAYVMATVSFLRKDRKDFDHWAPLARGNEETIKRLTDGWGQPYKQAYAGQQGVTEGDKMSLINLDQSLANTPPVWKKFISSLPPQLAREFVDERPRPDQDDIDFLTPLRLVSPQPVSVRVGDLLRHPENQATIGRSPDDVVAAVNQRWGLKIPSGKKYDPNPARYRAYAQMAPGTASPSVMADRVILFGAGRFVAAALRGDETMRVWSMTRKKGVTEGSVTKKPQPYHEPDWAKKLPKEKLNALAGPRYKKDKKEQGVAEGQLDPYRLERLDPQTRRVLQRMADHAEPGSWLSASEAYAMMLGLQYKNRDPRGWEQEVQHYVDLYRQYSGQGISEVKILSKVKGKGSEPGQLPRFGRPIAPGEETRYLGTKVADWQGREIWRDWLGGQLSYHLFDPQDRRVIVTTFGSRYKNNPQSYIIHGLYAAPGNPVRAAEFYRALVRDLGLTLISDRKQSPGGNKVWQQLEQFPDVEVYGYDTNTDTALNFGAGDVEMYTVPSAAVAGSKEMQRVARDLRLVATAR